MVIAPHIRERHTQGGHHGPVKAVPAPAAAAPAHVTCTPLTTDTMMQMYFTYTFFPNVERKEQMPWLVPND